jgi:CubicO group peptidase (beta-lactamase class C family)
MNGITNAESLAQMYRPLALGGTCDGVKLVGPDAIARMIRVESASALDASVLLPTRFSLGFWKSFLLRDPVTGLNETAVMGDAAFGHPGAGGAIGFADPEAHLSFGYIMNKQGSFMVNQRGQSLIDAVYRALGYRSRGAGIWVR